MQALHVRLCELDNLLPSEVGVIAAEVTVRRCLLVPLVASPPEVKVLGNNTGPEVKVLLDNGKDLSIVLGASSVGINIDGKGLRHTDGVGDLEEGPEG